MQTIERPKVRHTEQKEKYPEENARKSQQLLLTWLTDYPQLYPKIKAFLSAEDFTVELYSRVAKRMFEELEKNELNPAGIINMFEEEKEQSEAASLFTTTLPELESDQEREKAFHDILVSVKKTAMNTIRRVLAQTFRRSAK